MYTSTDHSGMSSCVCVWGGRGLPCLWYALSLYTPHTSLITHLTLTHYRMAATLSKIGEGAFADVFGCQGDDWRKLALKVRVIITLR